MPDSLIANTGIQIIRLKTTIDPNEDVTKSMRFYEWYDSTDFRVRLEFAHYLSAQDVWVSKRSLAVEGFLSDEGKVSELVNTNLLQVLTPGEDCFSVNDIETPLEYFENQWIPIPFFEVDESGQHEFGPISWCRVKMIPKAKRGAIKDYSVIVAFDTKLDEFDTSNPKEQPVFYGNDTSQNFSICSDDNLLLDFCNEEKGCGWVDEYIAQLIHGDTDNLPDDFPSLKYLAHYIYFVHYLEKKKIIPEVKLYHDPNAESIDVDLVLDIGNSRTCGLLFESTGTPSPFTKVKQLELQDLSELDKTYTDPFSMRLAFHKAEFGEMGLQNKHFVWPSILRLGEEANRLIYLSQNQDIEQRHKVTNHSSPKRYLWDIKESVSQWEFIQLEGANPIKSIYLEGVSEQFNSDGSFNPSTDFGVESSYSRKSLMTFVFLEILFNAYTQVNSDKFRTDHDNTTSHRRIRRIIVTCPTAMATQEQLNLRKSAEEATIVLHRFLNNGYNQNWDSKERPTIEIVPPVSDLKLKLTETDDKKDWAYDEATCCQLVYLFSEISMRYLNNCEDYFNLYGKYRSDLKGYNKKSITIGSIDIGAGTTDLMIASYKYHDAGKAVLTPVPLFWESFYYAGDDLLKQVIQQVVIEGTVQEEEFRGCTGVIQNYMVENNIDNISEKLINFFGEDSNKMPYRARQMRRDFNVQISIPIALLYLDLTQKQSTDHFINFKDIFVSHRPKDELLSYFEEHFGFRFEEIVWKFSANRVNQIIERVFEPLLKKVSSILYAYGCDFVLLAGKPTSLHRIGELFFKLYPVSPDKLITLNDYRVGKWYPFANGNGYFEDQKSLVAVGAMIGYLGGVADSLDNFRLDMSEMKKKLLSTAKNMGLYDKNTKNTGAAFISPEINRASLQISGVPTIIGCQQLDTATYPSRPLYVLDFDKDNIRKKIRDFKGISDITALNDEVNRYITNLQNNMPFTVKLYREYRTDREDLFIDAILDKNRDDVSSSFFKLSIKTLPDEEDYWLDSGGFILGING